MSKQGLGVVIDEVGSKLPVKSILFCNMTPFIITKDGDVDRFKGGKMDFIYQADDQYFEFFEEQGQQVANWEEPKHYNKCLSSSYW